MRPWLTLDELLNRCQQEPKPGFSFSQIELERAIRLSHQAADRFAAADYINAIRTPGIAVVDDRESSYIKKHDDASQDFIGRQNQATARNEKIAT